MSTKSKSLLQVIDPSAGGIDLGSSSHFVAINPEVADSPVKEFGCFTCDLQEMGGWLLSYDCKSVAMEATGVYWLPVYEVLSSMGIAVHLVDARKVHGLPGRRKSDVQDCQWLRELHSYGLLSSCFVPDAESLPSRSYYRQRESIVSDRSKQILLMQKALDQMNIHIHKVLSDITGVTGMEIIRAILSGERDPRALAAKRRAGVKRSEEDIVKALQGTYAEHYMFNLAQAVEMYDKYGQMLAQVDERLKVELERLTSLFSRSLPEPYNTKRAPRKNQPRFDLSGTLVGLTGMDLTKINGLSTISVLGVLAECGLDFTRWRTYRHYTSWLQLAPCNRISGGKHLRKKRQQNYGTASQIFRLAAQSLHGSKCALGSQFRRIAARRSKSVAIKAIARKIAIAFYNAMTKGQDFVDIGSAKYEEQLHQEQLKRTSKMATKLGYSLVPISPTPEAAMTGVS